MVTVELFYFPGCPHVGRARKNLYRALGEVALPARWVERNLSDPTIEAAAPLSSPTILINGKDIAEPVAADKGESGALHCRLYHLPEGGVSGVPPLALIVSALRAADATAPRRSWAIGLINIPTLMAAILPAAKCPACLTAYAGVLSSLGIANVLLAEILLPLTVVLVLLTLGTLLYRARYQRGYGPFWLGLGAGVVLIVGKFWWDFSALWYGGAVGLVVASIWNAWPRKVAPAACSACSPSTIAVKEVSS